MNFRERLVIAASFTSLLALGGAFAAVYVTVYVEHAREVDLVLDVEGHEEARSIARSERTAAITEDPGLIAAGVGPLHLYAVLYGADGSVRARSRLVGDRAPPIAPMDAPLEKPFDTSIGPTRVRAEMIAIPGRTERLLFGVAREPLDWDAAFLARAMVTAFIAAVLWVVVVTWWLVRRMTREHVGIADVARRVAEGDLTARVGGKTAAHADIAQLGHDIDRMIDRLASLVTSQQRFVSYAAHELRSPITATYGELANALRKERDAGYYREAMQNAFESAQRLKMLAEDLLAFARVRADLPAPSKAVSLAEAARAAIADLLPAAGARGIAVGIDGDAKIDTTNARDLERLVRNLVDNAIKHSPDGGRVRIAIAGGDAVTLAVEDDGPGVAETDSELVFEPFFRGPREEAREGTGLGLAIVRGIAKAHGGDVALDPTRGGRDVGARFVVSLPRSHRGV